MPRFFPGRGTALPPARARGSGAAVGAAGPLGTGRAHLGTRPRAPAASHPECPAVPGVPGSALPAGVGFAAGGGWAAGSPAPRLRLFFLHASGSAEKVVANG